VRNLTRGARLAPQHPPAPWGPRAADGGRGTPASQGQVTAHSALPGFFTTPLREPSPSFSNPPFPSCSECKAPWWVSSLKPSTASANNSNKPHSGHILHTEDFMFYAQSPVKFFCFNLVTSNKTFQLCFQSLCFLVQNQTVLFWSYICKNKPLNSKRTDAPDTKSDTLIIFNTRPQIS